MKMIADSPVPGSPDALIEEGISSIARALFRLDKQDPAKAEFELSVLVDFFLKMHVEAMRKSQTVGGSPFPR